VAWIAQGAAIGLAGGLAEILVVGAYAKVAHVDAAAVAGAIATAVHVDPGSAVTGVAVHIGLSALLGIALLGAARASRTLRKGSASIAAAAALVALAAIWAVNFLVVLPWLSPGFVHLLPYPVTLASKLMFAVAATAAWRCPRSFQGAPGRRLTPGTGTSPLAVAGTRDGEYRRWTSANIARIWVAASDLTKPSAAPSGTQNGKSMVAEYAMAHPACAVGVKMVEETMDISSPGRLRLSMSAGSRIVSSRSDW